MMFPKFSDFTLLVAMVTGLLAAAPDALAAGGNTKPLEHKHWSFSGPFGKYDPDTLQRGFQVYREVCASCHSLDLVAFRHLGDKGGPFYMEQCPTGFPETTNCSNPSDNPIIKALAAEYDIMDGPDDSGDMYTRPGLPSDYFPGPYDNQVIAALANGGAVPPDMSLLAKARMHGPDYIYSLLTGYETPPKYISVSAGTYYNPYFPGDSLSLIKAEYLDEDGHPIKGVKVPYGGAFKMAAPLRDEIVDYYAEDVPETVAQYAYDVTNFMMWAAEPKLEERKSIGVIVLVYLVILAGILYASYRQIWADVT